MHLTLENMNSKTNPALQYGLSDYVAISSFHISRKRTYSFRLILHALFILGMISTGCKSKHPDGSEFVGEINQIDGSGNKHGPWMIYADTVLVAKGSYVDGKPDGLWTYWYGNGQMKEEGHFDQGVKNGMWVEWYSDSNLMWKGEWKNGTRHIAYLDAKAESDLFILYTSSDTILSMSIGYVPDLEFKDYRNFVREIDFRIR